MFNLLVCIIFVKNTKIGIVVRFFVNIASITNSVFE